jgi:hypothetical protein
MLSVSKVRFFFVIVFILLLSSSLSHSQLLRPFYVDCCKELEHKRTDLSFRYEIDGFPADPQSVTLINDAGYDLIVDTSSVFPEWINEVRFEGEELVVDVLPYYSVADLKFEFAVLAEICYSCTDTLYVVEVEYTVRKYQQMKFLQWAEVGYINSNISNSVKSIFGNEVYEDMTNHGFLVGLNIFEYKSPSYLSDFGLSLAILYRQAGLSGFKDGISTTVQSSSDISLRFVGDLPLTFVSDDIGAVSLKTYLTLPGMSLSNLHFDGDAGDLNDNITLNIAYGLGVKYQISRSVAVEARMIINEFETNSDQDFSSDKITYDDVRNEITISVNNLYEKINDIFTK